MANTSNKVVKNITIDRELSEILEAEAQKEGLKLSTWINWYLNKIFLKKDTAKKEVKKK
jgi:predicted HicB family RNase H-like nuclease